LALLAGFFSLLRRRASVPSLPSALVFFISSSCDEEIHERYTHLDVETKRRALSHLRPLA